MPVPLEITLILALVALVAALVPLLLQLTRTAKGLETFLRSVQQDFSRIAEDAHASRQQMEGLAASLQTSLDELAGLARVAGDAGRMAKALQAQCQSGMNTASRVIGSLLGGLDAVRAFFRSPQPTE